MDTAESEIVVPAERTETWEALTEGEQLAEWLAGEPAELELRPGGELRIRVDGEERSGFFEEVAEPRRLVFWWGDGEGESSRVEIELEPDRDGTRVRVTESRPLAVLDARGIELDSWLGGDDAAAGGAAPRMRAAALSALR